MPSGRKRTWTDDQLREAVKAHITIIGVLGALGLSTSPGNYKTFHRHVKRLALDTSHFGGCRSYTNRIQWTLKKIMVENSLYRGSNQKLVKKLIQAGRMDEQCHKCGQPPEWQGEHLTLQLDHINGDPFDQRRENLRLLCPNCHTQTRNFCKNKTGRYRSENKCPDCASPISRESLRCSRCAGLHNTKDRTKIEWPPLDELEAMVLATSYVAIGHRLGVSDNAIRKHIRSEKWKLRCAANSE